MSIIWCNKKVKGKYLCVTKTTFQLTQTIFVMAAFKRIEMKAYFGMEDFAKLRFPNSSSTESDKWSIFSKEGLIDSLHSHNCKICNLHNIQIFHLFLFDLYSNNEATE